jgi:tetratricopeptide (TPR) repeat protein
MNELDGAIRENQIAIELQPNNADYRVALGDTFYGQGRFADAEAVYRKAIEQFPMDAGMHRNLGDALRRQERLDAAIDEYRRAAELDPEDPRAYYGLAVSLSQKANSAGAEASRVDLLTQACRVLTEGLRQAPENPALQQERAAIAAKLPDSAECAPGSLPVGR